MSKRKRHINRFVRILLTGLVLVSLSGRLSAQESIFDRLFRKNKDGGEQTDSADVKEKKPLESYFFDDDSLRNRLLFAWEMVPGFNQIKRIEVDTMLNRFDVDYPFMRHDVGSAYLGNLGGATYRLNYFERANNRDFAMLNAYDDYLFFPDRVPYFNVKRPFTNLSFFMAGQTKYSEQHLRVTHAQNISPSTGINIHYLNRKTWGIYSSQRATDKNLSMALNHTGKRYSLHAGYIYNMGDLEENGGLEWDNSLLDKEIDVSENIPVRLHDNSAKNVFKTNTFYANQAYAIPLQRVTDMDLSLADKSSFFVGHAFEYTKAYRMYTDDRTNAEYTKGDPNFEETDQQGNLLQWPNHPDAPHTVNYYPHWYLNPNHSVDSVREHKLDNKFYVQIQPWNRDGIVGTLDAGIGHSLLRYEMFHPTNYLVKGKKDKKNDTYIYGGVRGKFRKYLDWSTNAEYHIAGMRSQDLLLAGQLSLSAYIRQHPITLTFSAQIEDRTPDYWMQNYRSNHHIWENDFSKETDTRFEAKLTIPSIDFEAGFWQSLTKDKLYYGYDVTGTSRVALPNTSPARDTLVVAYNVMPKQFSGKTLSITGFYVMKNFHAGAFHFNHRVLIQKSSDEEIVSLPLVSAYASYYADFQLVRNVLRLQIGLTGFYNSEYYASGYNPSLMQFHNQNFHDQNKEYGNAVNDIEKPKKIGNYPYVDFFVSAKWKRMRILAKFQHVNQDLFGNSSYFSVLHHPLNRRMVKLGASWSFYD